MKDNLIRCKQKPYSIRIFQTYLEKRKGKPYEIKPLGADVFPMGKSVETLVIKFRQGEKWVCNENMDSHTFDFVCVNREKATKKDRIIEVLDLNDLAKLDTGENLYEH